MYLLYILITILCFKYVDTGQGGYITLINETNSDWELIGQQSYDMNIWNFPNLIKTQSVSHIYVEWSGKLFCKTLDNQATAIYRLIGAGDKMFFIQAEDFKIIIFYHNILIDGKPGNSAFNLGWVNGGVTFVLIEYSGHFTGNNLNAADWIKNNLGMLGNRSLKQICIPGTHNSGMSVLCNGSTFFSYPCNTLTQSHTIKGQLHLGMRYFDIRPILKQLQFMTGHYEKIPGCWQGGVGQSINSIVEEINDFTDSHREIIIISLSHSLNTDLKNKKFRRFNQSEWEGLFNELDRIEHLYHAESLKKLYELTINELTKNGQTSAVIIEVKEIGVELKHRCGKGYFYANSIEIYDVYSKTNRLAEMAADQIIKMAQYSKDYYFLLSWTLTQNLKEAALCQTRGINSIKDLAKAANSHLAYYIYPQISPNSYPNIICIDDVKNTEVVAITLAINKKIL